MSKKSAGSAKSRKKKSKKDPRRPFDRAILKQAREIVSQYRLILEPDDEVGFIGKSLELPNVMADGQTPDECVRATQEALEATVATLLELGKRPPAPSTKSNRQAQINIRVTLEEKVRLEEASHRKGFRGLSDYVRAAALQECGAD